MRQAPFECAAERRRAPVERGARAWPVRGEPLAALPMRPPCPRDLDCRVAGVKLCAVGRGRYLVWLRVLCVALALPLTFSSTLPVFARAAAGPEEHVCPCHLRGSQSPCECPMCQDHQHWRVIAIGRCGDGDSFYGASLGSALPTAPRVRVLPAERIAAFSESALARAPAVFLEPPTPPPRSSLS